jgi:hypothetical protein
MFSKGPSVFTVPRPFAVFPRAFHLFSRPPSWPCSWLATDPASASTPSTSWNPEIPLRFPHVEVCIQGWKVQAEAGPANFHCFKLRGLGVSQSFDIAGREAHDDLGTEFNNDPPRPTNIVRGNRSWDTSFHLFGALVRQFEIVTRCHEFAPKLGTTPSGDQPIRHDPPDLPARESIVLAKLYRSCRTVQVEYCFATPPIT